MLMLEFWEAGIKRAECPANEVFELSQDKRETFWALQDDLNREIRLRVTEED